MDYRNGYPKIYIVGTNQLHYALIAHCLKNDLKAECVFHAGPPSREFTDNEMDRQKVWLLDCLDLDASELATRFDNFAGTLPNYSLIALFNVEPRWRLERFVKLNRIHGIFYKNDSREVFLKGIRSMLNGRLWLSRKMLSDCILLPNELFIPLVRDMKRLSGREKVVLQSVASGASNQEIADTLCISVSTVKTHLSKIYKKINVPNRLQATLWVNACHLKLPGSQKPAIAGGPKMKKSNDGTTIS